MPVRRLVAGGRGDEFRFISGGVFHLVKINKICEGGHVKQKVAGAQKKGRPHGVAPTANLLQIHDSFRSATADGVLWRTLRERLFQIYDSFRYRFGP